MKQTVQALQCLDPLGRVRLAVQQGPQIDPGQLCQQVGKADKAAEHAVAIEAIREIGVPRTSDKAAFVPIRTRLGVEPGPQLVAIAGRVGGRSRLAEELPEIVVFGKCTKTRELKLKQREMGFVEIDGEDLGRLGLQVRQRVAATR